MYKILKLCFLSVTLFLLSLHIVVADSFDIDKVFQKVENENKKHEKRINAAFSAFEQVKESGSYIDAITDIFTDGIITLPVGIENSGYHFIIHSVDNTDDENINKLFVSVAFDFKYDNESIAFDGYIYVEGVSGLGTSGSLELIAPVRKKMGNNLSLIIENGTKVNFGCEGVESFDAKLKLLVNSDKIVAVNNLGEPITEALGAAFEAQIEDFESYYLQFDFNHSFIFKGLEDFVFTLKGAVLDQSDIYTPQTIQFPDGYAIKDNPLDRNLWRGVYISDATVVLPQYFKKSKGGENNKDIGKRFSLSLKNALFDSGGFSGDVETDLEIISSELIDKDKWDLSLSGFKLSFLRNNIKALAFGGMINIPPFGEKSLIPYSASYNYQLNSYELTAQISGDFKLPFLSASLDLNDYSFAQVEIIDGKVYPTLDMCGKISFDASLGGGEIGDRLTVPDISFQNMKISRKEPYFELGSIGIVGNISSPKIAGFELDISDITPFSDEYVGVRFNADVKLADIFGGSTSIELYGDYKTWKFKKVEVDKIAIFYSQPKAFDIEGGVYFKNGDEVYGNGFRGDLRLSIINRFTLDAVGVFGKTSGYRYFLTDVFFESSAGITIPPVPIAFYGFGGGMYRRMQQSNQNNQSEFGRSLSGISYVPDKTVGMGFMASTKFGITGVKSLFNANVGFEMQFNSSGGLNFVQLRGDASIMANSNIFGSLSENIGKTFSDVTIKGKEISISEMADVPSIKNQGMFTATFLMNYDATNNVFSADLNSYLNVFNVIKGVGENDRLGYASMRFANDGWYAYMGTPTDRLGIEVLNFVTLDGYFMMGDGIPELPIPPDKVINNLSAERRAKILNRAENSVLRDGKGMAFGKSLEIDINAKLVPFYGRLAIGMGSEFMLKNYGAGAYCAGSNTTLGMNGWYARAQAWAYIDAAMGLEARLFGKRRSFEIGSFSVATLLQGSGPNPYYFAGSLGGRYRVMGGLLSGSFSFDFDIGKECIVSGGNPFGEDIIAQITPENNEKDVNVFAVPQVIFNVPINLEMEMEEENGETAWYRVVLKNIECFYKANLKKVDGVMRLAEEGRVYIIDTDSPFESQKDIIVKVKVELERKLNGEWVKVKDANNENIYEEKQIAFKSGDRPKYIMPEHMAYSYPMDRQYNFYTKEYDKGYFLVSENYSYLFTTDKPAGYKQLIKLEDSDGNTQTTTFTHGKSNIDKVKYEINFNTDKIRFNKNEIYSLSIVNVPIETKNIADNVEKKEVNIGNADGEMILTKREATGTLDILEEDFIYTAHFRTSNYETFGEKVEAIKTNKLWTFADNVLINVDDFMYYYENKIESFDQYEVGEKAKNVKFVKLEADIDNTVWYKNSIYPNMYKTVSSSELTSQRRNITNPYNHFSIPPKEAIDIRYYKGFDLLTDEELKIGVTINEQRIERFEYNLPYYIALDLKRIKNIIANKNILANKRTKIEQSVLALDLPVPTIKGNYPFNLSYVLPGKNIKTTSHSINIKIDK